MLASAGNDSTVRLWDVATKRPIGELRGHTSAVYGVAFSPDGEKLASGSADKTVRLWDVATRQPVGEPLTGHTSNVYSVAFSPDGKTLASGSYDKTVRLWDVTTRRPFGEPIETAAVGFSMAFNPDGKTLASAINDNRVWLWDVDPVSWASRACNRANRNLSRDEWEHYIGINARYQRTCANLPPGEGVPTK